MVLLLMECAVLCSAFSGVITSKHILVPSCIQCEALTQSYPVTLFNKLFSSVPKRAFAIQDVSLTFGDAKDGDNNFNLLVGRSASGKTTILRILSGEEEPASGNVLLNRSQLFPSMKRSNGLPKPIMLDTKPDCYDDRFTVLERIKEAAGKHLSSAEIDSSKFIEGLAKEFASTLNLSSEQTNGYPSALSPSGQYVFGIACACMQSSCASIHSIGEDVVEVPCPILLLDELLDSETSGVASKVGEALHSLTKRGAIVLAATHRPEYLKSSADRVITLSGGKVLIDEKCITVYNN